MKPDLTLVKGWAKFNYHPQYKTAVPYEANLFKIITRVNYLTASLWLQFIKEYKLEHIPDKVNWLVMNRKWRREKEKLITKLKTN